MSLELRKKGKTKIIRYSQTMYVSDAVTLTVAQRWHVIPGLLALMARHTKIKIRRITLWGGMTTPSTASHFGEVIVARSFGIPVGSEVIRIPFGNIRPYAMVSWQFIQAATDDTDLVYGLKDDQVWSEEDAPEIQPHPPGHSFGMVGLSMFVRINTTTFPTIHGAAYVTVDHIVRQRRTRDDPREYKGIQDFEDSHDHILPHLG